MTYNKSMNANSGEAPKFEMPPMPVLHEGQNEADRGREQPSSQETAVAKQAPVAQLPAQPIVPDPVSLQSIPAASPVGSAKDDTHQALTAADVDRIEKEWVDRAKAVVGRTRDDPYAQNSEMSKVKADYIKKRFNKTLPTDDAVPA